MKVHISPWSPEIERTNGVAQVLYAQYKLLPEFGIELVQNPEEADVIAAHITADHLKEVHVLHLHGLLYTADTQYGPYPDSDHALNKKIIEAARRARAITMPSEWASMPFKRDMRITPEVIPNGVWLDEWEPKEHKGYVLWAKNRADNICNPQDAYELATMGTPVVSTFAPTNIRQLPPNFYVTGKLPFEEMKALLSHAEMYLSTTKENNSLAVWEAMAAGVPVLGYDYGGNSEQVRHRVDGYLARPGDLQDLFSGWEFIKANRATLSRAARERAQGYDWRNIIQRYADLYQRTFSLRNNEKYGVAVVVTSYNYGKYLGAALDSLLNQTFKPAEIVVVDDGSTDNTTEIAKTFEAQGVKVITQKNQGVAAARNNGIAATKSELLICLDADDQLQPTYIEKMREAFVSDPALGVAYSDMALLKEDGSVQTGVFTSDFKWEVQAKGGERPQNCVPCAAMFRKSMWQRSGGYIQKYHPAEDAEFWARGLSLGFKAVKASQEPLFIYRTHHDSAYNSNPIKRIDIYHPWMNDRLYPMAAPAQNAPVIRSYSEPLVTVVIPVGPGHAKFVPDALESLIGQTFRDWKVVVIWDGLVQDRPNAPEAHLKSMEERAYLANLMKTTYPFATYKETIGLQGAGYTRNCGLERVKTPLVLWLDADDTLHTQALEKMLYQYGKTGQYVYADYRNVEPDGSSVVRNSPEYQQDAWHAHALHPVTVLMETEHAREVGGFDQEMSGFEDWDFFAKLAVKGYCGVRWPEPLLNYRLHTGQRRNNAHTKQDELIGLIKGRYERILTEGKQMACCGGSPQIVKQVQDALQAEAGLISSHTGLRAEGGKIKMEYVGENQAPNGSFNVNGHRYIGANNPEQKYVWAWPEDVEQLVMSARWRQSFA
jgi:glycosyltransferase involved in cell wall biosynthesis